MVHLTCARLGLMRTFGLRTGGKYHNHRVHIKHKRFAVGLDTESIIAHHSRDDFDKIDRRADERTFKDAQTNMGTKVHLLPHLREEDLKMNSIFQKELDRQRGVIARINKIRVIIESEPGKNTELMMNKEISTPYDCACHIHDMVAERSVVAELNPIESAADPKVETPTDLSPPSRSNSIYWDMHRPLHEDCRLKFRHFLEHDVGLVNKIYWRSCSFVLGMAIRLAFKDNIRVLIHSWPKPNIKSGSFIYDVGLNLAETWRPTEQELRAFTKILWNIKTAAMPFDRLDVKKDLARDLFQYNPFKLAQIESMGDESTKITVYRCGGLVDMSIGPMISDTSQIGRITLASIHPYESNSPELKGIFYRFQGVSLPQQLPLSSYVYQNILINRARQLNKASL